MIKARVIKHGIAYVDLYNEGIVKPLACTGDDIAIDGAYPNDKGYLIVAK